MFESCTRNFSSLRNPHSRVPKFVFGVRESLSPVPSPNGEGSENCCLQVKESLSPSPSPNGEGSENHCLQIKEAFL